MKNANIPATKRSRNRERRTKPGGDLTATVQIRISQADAEALRYLQRERDMAPEEVLRLGLRYSGI